MIEHRIQKALVARIAALSPGWSAYHDHSAGAKTMPRIVVTSGATSQKVSFRSLDCEIRLCWLPDDTTDDSAHDVAETVRMGLESKGATYAAMNAILNAYGVGITWLGFVGYDQGEDGERERFISQTYRVQYTTSA